jgi:hypothetical protein
MLLLARVAREAEGLTMGLLDNVLGGGPTRSSSGMSPITMTLLGLLAYRT